MLLSQIVARQQRLQEAYAAANKNRKKPEVVVVAPTILPPPMPAQEPVLSLPELVTEEEVLALPAPSIKEKTIAVALPLSLHGRAEAIMKQTKFTGSKREFFQTVLHAAFAVLEPNK